MTSDVVSTSETRLEPQLLRLWNDFLKRSDLTIDDDFFESGGDSLLAAELLLEIQNLTEMLLPPSIIFETGTVRQLTARLNDATGFAPQLSVRLGNKEGRLFHFFHGDFIHGGVSVRRLAAKLGPEPPILAIAPHGLGGGHVPGSIEEMATDRLPIILQAQPKGPFLLGGHCNGALVAFETARLLTDAGHEVDLVVMIDPMVGSVRRWGRARLETVDLINRLRGLPPDRRRQSLRMAWQRLAKVETRVKKGHQSLVWRVLNKSWLERCQAIGRRASRALFINSAMEDTLTGPETPFRGSQSNSGSLDEPQKALIEAYECAFSVYRPSPLTVPVFYMALHYSGRGWRGMSPRLEFVDFPGHHYDCLSGDSAEVIVDCLRTRLNALQPHT